MSKRARISLFAGLLFVIAALIFAVTRSHEPAYQGKKLSEWLEEGASQDVPYSSSPETRIAVRQIGTNALPFLLDMLRSQDSRVKRKLQEWCARQNVINVSFHSWEDDGRLAIGGFYLLGEIAKPAIPSLVEMSKDSNLCFYACTALRMIGNDALSALTNATSSTNQTSREAAVFALSEMGTNAESVLPLLVGFLLDSDSSIRWRWPTLWLLSEPINLNS